MDDLVYIKLKHSLRDTDLQKKIIEVVESKIKILPDYLQLKTHPELILLVCNMIENSVIDRKIKLNKKELLMKVLQSIYTYTELEKKQVFETLEFLHANKLIKKVSFVKKCSAVVFDFIKRKFL